MGSGPSRLLQNHPATQEFLDGRVEGTYAAEPMPILSTSILAPEGATTPLGLAVAARQCVFLPIVRGAVALTAVGGLGEVRGDIHRLCLSDYGAVSARAGRYPADIGPALSRLRHPLPEAVRSGWAQALMRLGAADSRRHTYLP